MPTRPPPSGAGWALRRDTASRLIPLPQGHGSFRPHAASGIRSCGRADPTPRAEKGAPERFNVVLSRPPIDTTAAFPSQFLVKGSQAEVVMPKKRGGWTPRECISDEPIDLDDWARRYVRAGGAGGA